MANGWKQPTPTDGLRNENLNTLDWMIFLYAWNMVRREKGVYEFWHGNKFISAEVDRGECIFIVSKIARELEIDHKRVRKSIEKLKKWYTEMEIETKPYGLLLRFKDVDSLLSMESEMENERRAKGERKESERRSNKKNVENEESEYILESRQVGSAKEVTVILLGFYNRLFNKSQKFTDGKYRQTLDRLKTFTPDELSVAIKKAAKSDFHRGKNDRDWVADYEYIMRSDENVDKLINL